MIRIQLPQADVERLQEAFRSTKDCKLRSRLQIVLLAHRGQQHQDIAAALCINRRSVQRWLNAYLEHGLDALRPRQAKGASGKIPAELADESNAGSSRGRPNRDWIGPTGHTRN